MTTCAASRPATGHTHTCTQHTGSNHFCVVCRRWWWDQ